MRALHERYTVDGHTALWYHGKDSNPKLTLTYQGNNGDYFELNVPENEAMDYYLHPHFYRYKVS